MHQRRCIANIIDRADVRLFFASQNGRYPRRFDITRFSLDRAARDDPADSAKIRWFVF
jgi:hypothetical protein